MSENLGEIDPALEKALHGVKYISGAYKKLICDINNSEKDLKKIDNAVTKNRKDIKRVLADADLLKEQIENHWEELNDIQNKYDKEFVTKLNYDLRLSNGYGHLSELIKELLFNSIKKSKTEKIIPIKIKYKKDEIVIRRLRNGG